MFVPAIMLSGKYDSAAFLSECENTGDMTSLGVKSTLTYIVPAHIA